MASLTVYAMSHPEKSFRAFLGYYTKSVRGIWHVKWSDQYGYYVAYTHPDTYIHYPWIGVESSVGLEGNNLAAAHIPKSVVDTYNLANIIGAGLGGVVAGAVITGIIGIIVGALVFLAGVIAAVFVDWYIRDEEGAGWLWLQNWWGSWYGTGTDLKIGSFMWLRFGIAFGIPYYYPLWYGGRALGFDGM